MDVAFLAFMNQFGYVAVASLVLLECVFPPIPSEVIIPAAGALCLTTGMTLPGAVIAATLGATAGATVLYGIGSMLSPERLIAFFESRPMRLLGFKSGDVMRAVEWFDKKGQLTVLFCRCVPVVRSLVSVPAGTAKMRLPRFLLYTFLGSLVWNIVLCGLGYAAGNAWQSVSAQVSGFSDLVTYAIAGIFGIGIIWWGVKRVAPALKSASANA